MLRVEFSVEYRRAVAGKRAVAGEPRLRRGPPPSQLVAGQSGRAAASKQRPSESGTWRTSTDTSSPQGSSQLSAAVIDRGSRETQSQVSPTEVFGGQR